ncbi:MAG: ABC transporter substrate-binding protein [Alphaproteobacteria bacterium]|nr:MAG: ABC transporter substrate-binding protein [Alphaproteobacteria bacterium]
MKALWITAAVSAALMAAPAAAQTQGVSDTEIKIGAHHDLSGIFAGFSVPAVKAAQLYFDEINAKGGVHGRKITYIVEDHGYNPSKAVQLVNKLVNSDKVFAMLLSLGTPHNLAAFKIQDPAGIPNVSPLSAARQMLDPPLDLHYAGTSSYYDAIRTAVRWMKENEGSTTVCSMYLPTDFGEEIQAASADESKELGLNYATETTHKPDEADFTGPLQKLNEAGCDLVTMALGIKQTITVLGTAKKLGYDKMKFLGSSASFHTAIAKVPGGITEGFYAAAGWQDLEARAGDPEVAAWIKSYTQATGEEFPGTGALLGRSAAELMVRALEAAGPDLTHASFQAAMESLDYYDKIAGNQVKMGPGDHLGADAIYISRIEGGSWKTLASTM